MKLSVTPSPHIASGETTRKLMGWTGAALVPALGAGVWFFGPRALALTVATVLSCLVGEWAVGRLSGRGNSLSDGSAVLTGLLLTLSLPVTTPYWAAALGGVFAAIVGKGLLGGLGQNLFNPALTARAFLMLVCPVHLTRYPPAGSWPSLLGQWDGLTAATPLHHMQIPALPEEGLAGLFWGNVGGCVGETCAAALLLGGGILLARRVITWQIPAAYLGTVAALTLLFPKGEPPVEWMVCNLLTGGLLLGAFFMATDYATSPVTPGGRLVYGAGCGALTVLFRYYGLFPEGVTYAILLMNACAWALDRLLPPRPFGRAERREAA